MACGRNDRTDGKPPKRGGTFVCVASGPSLARWQCRYLRDKAVTTIATNTSFQAIESGICYGCDGIWWDKYHAEVRAKGLEAWTQDKAAAQNYGLNYIRGRKGRGLSREPHTICNGTNSGYQAIGLAYYLGAAEIVLIGYDMQRTGGRTHWHGDHPKGLRNVEGIERWIVHFGPLAEDLKAEGIEVVNCSIETALPCWPRADLRDVI